MLATQNGLKNQQQQEDELKYCSLFSCDFNQPDLSVGGGLRHGADGRDGSVGHSGGQRHGGQGGHTRLALLPLVGHEGRQRVELFLALSAQEDVLIIWDGERSSYHRS